MKKLMKAFKGPMMDEKMDMTSKVPKPPKIKSKKFIKASKAFKKGKAKNFTYGG